MQLETYMTSRLTENSSRCKIFIVVLYVLRAFVDCLKTGSKFILVMRIFGFDKGYPNYSTESSVRCAYVDIRNNIFTGSNTVSYRDFHAERVLL